MESNQAQANDLHKKFEALNEEITAALRVQQDAVASASTAIGNQSQLAAARKDALRLGKRTGDWRGNVSALAKQIDLQLQNSRALRSRYAQSLLSTTAAAQKLQEETDSSRLRCLRSDLRLLQEFRVRYARNQSDKDISDMEEETKQLQAFLEKSSKKEKMGGNQEQTVLVLELFEMRRDIMSRISEDLVKEKKQLDVEVGNPEALTTNDVMGDGSGASTEKDALASWDTQLYVILMQNLQDLQKEKRGRLVLRSRNSVVSLTPAGEGLGAISSEFRAESPTKSGNGSKGAVQVEDVHFLYQKLKREVEELKTTNAKLVLANSQLEDDLVHLQVKFEEEKRAHVNDKKWFMPKIQKLEDQVFITSKAFEEVKLSVELMANMYKHLSGTLSVHQEGEDELKRERDRVSLLLAGEIKKIAALTKEIERKDRLVTLAMAARYEMVQHANRHEQISKDATERLHREQYRAEQAEAGMVSLKRQLEETSQRLEATNTALSSAKESIVQLQGEVQAVAKAASTKETELLVAFEKQQAVMQQKLDKTKRELMESMSEVLNLDSRLRKAQEKLTKQATEGSQ